MAENRYEQQPGNVRCQCPACEEPIIVSVLIGPQKYTCTKTGQEVEAADVAWSMKNRSLLKLRVN